MILRLFVASFTTFTCIRGMTLLRVHGRADPEDWRNSGSQDSSFQMQFLGVRLDEYLNVLSNGLGRGSPAIWQPLAIC